MALLGRQKVLKRPRSHHRLAEFGVKSPNGKPHSNSSIYNLLTNPFYYGHFRYAKEVHEGKHDPIIAKKLFDKVQEVLKQRGKPRHKTKNEPQPFCGLLHCSCGMMITGEYKVRRQKNGNTHEYMYYHCSRKSKTTKCKEPCVRQEVLDRQISSLLKKVSLPQDWAEELQTMLEKDKKESAQSSTAFVQEAGERIRAIQTKLQRLLDGYLEQDIEREIYRVEKAKLLSEKKSLEEQITKLEQKQKCWVEPMKNWINYAQTLEKIASDSNLFLKKVAAKEVFGSNLFLQSREARVRAPSGKDSSEQNQWAALRAAHEMASEKPRNLVLVGTAGIEPTASSTSRKRSTTELSARKNQTTCPLGRILTKPRQKN